MKDPMRASTVRKAHRSHRDDECVLVLQGGGALGAFQAGAFEALAQTGPAPAWIAGISIGAINAALIAGNPPELQVRRLREFWEMATGGPTVPAPGILADVTVHRSLNRTNAALAALFGLPGFFTPRFPPAVLQRPGTPGALSHYDTEPLRRTLARLVDFDRINDGPIRLSVGAVNVRDGNFVYFDSAAQRLDVRHVMASAALPPGFPPIEIGGEWFWDGGLVSNTPLQYVIDQPGPRSRVVFQVDLFSCAGPMPSNLIQVTEREKDIRYSSRTRLNTSNALARHALAQAARRLTARLPDSMSDDPDVRALRAASHECAVTVVHLIYRRQPYDSDSKDYEFSRLSMQEHWEAGHADVIHTLQQPQWQNRTTPRDGVLVLDLSADREPELRAGENAEAATAQARQTCT